jgi:hypothetical protein
MFLQYCTLCARAQPNGMECLDTAADGGIIKVQFEHVASPPISRALPNHYRSDAKTKEIPIQRRGVSRQSCPYSLKGLYVNEILPCRATSRVLVSSRDGKDAYDVGPFAARVRRRKGWLTARADGSRFAHQMGCTDLKLKPTNSLVSIALHPPLFPVHRR